MYYILNKNVYLVKGVVNSCIYDLNESKLYSINNALSQKIELANKEGINKNTIDKELKKVFDELIQLKVLCLSNTIEYHDLQEIESPDNGCEFAWIEISNRCNLKCLHCYNESDIHCNKTMSFENFKKVIDNLIKIRVRRIQIIGGEPLIEQKLLKKMLEYTLGKFEFIEVFTNGTLISNEWIEYFKKNNIHVALSIYSYSANEHDKVTQIKGSWKKTNNAIKALKKNEIPYRVCNVLMKGISLGEKNTDLYELSSNKDVVRMSGRASFSLLSDDLIKKRLLKK